VCITQFPFAEEKKRRTEKDLQEPEAPDDSKAPKRLVSAKARWRLRQKPIRRRLSTLTPAKLSQQNMLRVKMKREARAAARKEMVRKQEEEEDEGAVEEQV